MALAQRLMTADELADRPADGLRHELIDGELTTMSPAGYIHGQLGMRLAGPLVGHVYAKGLGEVFLAETGFLLARDPDTVRAPDVAFVRRERVAAASTSGGPWFPGPPDLAVEIVSPGDHYTDIADTVAAWLAAGCRMVLVVDPRRRSVQVHQPVAGDPATSTVLELREADTIDGGEVVPGWSLPVAALFAEQPRPLTAP